MKFQVSYNSNKECHAQTPTKEWDMGLAQEKLKCFFQEISDKLYRNIFKSEGEWKLVTFRQTAEKQRTTLIVF